jgi:hypothetical protein
MEQPKMNDLQSNQEQKELSQLAETDLVKDQENEDIELADDNLTAITGGNNGNGNAGGNGRGVGGPGG